MFGINYFVNLDGTYRIAEQLYAKVSDMKLEPPSVFIKQIFDTGLDAGKQIIEAIQKISRV